MITPTSTIAKGIDFAPYLYLEKKDETTVTLYIAIPLIEGTNIQEIEQSPTPKGGYITVIEYKLKSSENTTRNIFYKKINLPFSEIEMNAKSDRTIEVRVLYDEEYYAYYQSTIFFNDHIKTSGGGSDNEKKFDESYLYIGESKAISPVNKDEIYAYIIQNEMNGTFLKGAVIVDRTTGEILRKNLDNGLVDNFNPTKFKEITFPKDNRNKPAPSKPSPFIKIA